MDAPADRSWRQLPAALVRSLALVRESAPRQLRTVVLLQVLGAVSLVTQLFLLRQVLHTVLTGSGLGDVGRLVPDLVVLAVAATAGSLASGLASEQQRLITELVRRHAMRRILAVTTTVDLAEFETGAFNDGLSRARQHAVVRPPQVVAGVLAVGQAVLSSAGLLVALATLAPEMLPVLVLAVVPGILVQRYNSRDLHTVDRSLSETDRRRWYLEDVLSSLAGAKEARVFRLDSFLGPLQDQLATTRVDRYRALVRRRSRRVAATSVVSALLLVAGLALLGGLVLTGHLSPASAATAGIVLQQLSTTLRSAGSGAATVYENSLFLAEVDQFLGAGADVAIEPVASQAPPARPGRLAAVDLCFTYPGTTRPVLRGVSVEIPAGQVVAVVGENGSGKTTFTKLLCGLYASTSGSVLWDGADAAGVDPQAWRNRFAVVFQDFMRYQLSARLNVAVGRQEAVDDLEGIRAAARLADADGFLSGLAGGYETLLSRAYDGGTDLSLGQWQRLALARAFFSGAPVLVLDEPTAALDPRVEQELLHRVQALAGTKTVVLVSHRLSSVRFADQILVLRHGELVERGTHTELVDLGGHYAELYGLQSAAYKDGPSP